jgi:hypothetical protein
MDRGIVLRRTICVTPITMLALAIGLNVTVFAIMNTMLFRGSPLVKRNSERGRYLHPELFE